MTRTKDRARSRAAKKKTSGKKPAAKKPADDDDDDADENDADEPPEDDAADDQGDDDVAGDAEDDDEPWYSTGYDEMERIPDGDDGVRFRMESKETRMVLFIDGDRNEDKERWDTKIGAPFCLWEYEIPVYGRNNKPRWGTFITSMKGRKTASGKRAKDHVRALARDASPEYKGMYTVADVTELWRDFEDGLLDPDHEDDEKDTKKKRRRRRRRRKKEDAEVEIKMLPARKRRMKEIRSVASKEGSCRGLVFEASRKNRWSDRTGNKWEFICRLSEEEIRQLISETADRPLDYLDILRPKSREEIEAIMENRVDPKELEERDKERDKERGGKRGGKRGRGGRDRDDDDDDDDRGRGRGRGRGRRRDRDDDDDDDDRNRGRGRGRGRGRDRDDDDDDDDRGKRRGRGRSRRDRDDDDDDDDDEKPRGRRGRSRRSRDDDDDDDQDDDDDDVDPDDDIDF